MQMGTLKNSKKTRDKLIEAAGLLFAKRGFNVVTVRDIVNQAKVPLSSINYHFGTKQILYREVLLEACKDVSTSYVDQKKLLNIEPYEALYIFINESIKLYKSDFVSRWKVALITRECWDPSNVFDDVMKEYLKPEADFMATLISRIVDKPLAHFQIRFAVVTLVGLLDSFSSYGRYINGVAPGLENYLSNNDLLAKQIYQIIINLVEASAS